MMIRSMGAGEGFIPQSLMLKVLAEPDEKGYYHYLLAQALLSHLQHTQIDANILVDVDWENTILSQFGPQIVNREVVLPPPPPKTNVMPQGPNKTLFDNQDPQRESLPLFAAGLSSYDKSIFADEDNKASYEAEERMKRHKAAVRQRKRERERERQNAIDGQHESVEGDVFVHWD